MDKLSKSEKVSLFPPPYYYTQPFTFFTRTPENLTYTNRLIKTKGLVNSCHYRVLKLNVSDRTFIQIIWGIKCVFY